MAGNSVLQEVTLSLPMDSGMELTACDTAGSLAEAMSMSPDKIDEVRQAVVEAFINAVEYSHAEDKMVHLTVAVVGDREPEKLLVTIRDTGRGFDRTKIERPSIADKLKSQHKRGWGLTIIEGLMDEVTIQSSDHGTTVVMSKAR